ncbi:MAG: hypothetical protein WAN71_26425, partial [Mycobacterium sp.]|uniref:hypothetical protein n=1 Tax=Mycobacterium sp. TaxID=1785 RepID=UPI003BAE9326
MGDSLAKILPTLFEALKAIQSSQLPNRGDFGSNVLVPADRVDNRPRQTVGPEGVFNDPDGFSTYAFEVVLCGVRGHDRDNRFGFGERGGD